MSGFPSRVGSLVAALILLMAPAPQAIAAGAHDHATHSHAAQASPVVAALGCAGHTHALDDTGMCTHGVDPVPDFIRDRGAPSRVSNLTPRLNSTSKVGCDGNGTSGKRVQALYVHVSGRPNRRPAWIASFRLWASNVDAMFKSSAAETGGNRRLRWVTNAKCLLSVPAVAVTPAAETSFGTLISELSALGYNRPDRKYLVWIDSDRTKATGCGVATLWNDDRPTGNLNNERAAYGRIDFVCWDWAEQHEMMHMLGAVQTTAPNATPGLHCSDEYDQMCYDDNGLAPPGMRYICPSRYERLFDCNHDDYFSTSPAPGSYLATHWNAANSGWLVNAPPPPTPPVNDAFAAATTLSGLSGTRSGTTLAATQESGEAAATDTSGQVDSVWYAWTAPQDGVLLVDTCGSALDTTLGAWTGTAIGALMLVAANDDDPTSECGTASRIQFDVGSGVAYRISVDGRGTAEGPFTLRWRFVPAGTEADLVPPNVLPAGVALSAPQTLGTSVSALVTWPEATDDSGVATYELQRRRNNKAWLTVALADPTATSAATTLPTGSRYSFRVRATDAVGNTSPWVTSSTGKVVVLQETNAAITYAGKFPRSALSGASGGRVRRAGAVGRKATLTFTGRAVAFVTTVGPNRGVAEVRIDGGAWQALDLYSTTVSTRRVSWTAASGPGKHTVEVRVTGTRNVASAGSRVDIDAFVVWR